MTHGPTPGRDRCQQGQRIGGSTSTQLPAKSPRTGWTITCQEVKSSRQHPVQRMPPSCSMPSALLWPRSSSVRTSPLLPSFLRGASGHTPEQSIRFGNPQMNPTISPGTRRGSRLLSGSAVRADSCSADSEGFVRLNTAGYRVPPVRRTVPYELPGRVLCIQAVTTAKGSPAVRLPAGPAGLFYRPQFISQQDCPL
jgi:hypothetical protein